MEYYALSGEKRCIILDYLNSNADVEALQSTFELFDFTVDCPEVDKLTRDGTQQLLEEGMKFVVVLERLFVFLHF